jgi:hypothetical protein
MCVCVCECKCVSLRVCACVNAYIYIYVCVFTASLIVHSQIPDELHELGENIAVALVDEHDKPYAPPPKRPPPSFSGEGMVLGATTAPAVAIDTSAAVSCACWVATLVLAIPSRHSVTLSSSRCLFSRSLTLQPLGEVSCDPSKPSTRIQFRLADGTRCVEGIC